jgi:hypothetical protein
MTRNTKWVVIGITACVIGVGAVGYWVVTQESPEEQKFKRIADGMTVEEVEGILGAGEVIPQAEVMGYRVPVNPEEEEAFRERHRKVGTVPTAREHETRNRYVVEGDPVYHWRLGSFEVWVAFKDGKVCEKYLKDWNYL